MGWFSVMLFLMAVKYRQRDDVGRNNNLLSCPFPVFLNGLERASRDDKWAVKPFYLSFLVGWNVHPVRCWWAVKPFYHLTFFLPASPPSAVAGVADQACHCSPSLRLLCDRHIVMLSGSIRYVRARTQYIPVELKFFIRCWSVDYWSRRNGFISCAVLACCWCIEMVAPFSCSQMMYQKLGVHFFS